ncbi:hypothetical protein AVEN_4915-1 [Araneus ventricosus]|uniref:Transposase Tc1-like domain-containing protein n=1 Tax=Araneus ventricosus TaxID=182803 RepID=A0A4Y2N8R9_ARAVE|nr:hypothetical protein AVEN_4915-1 [Araneus ventricosus]
MGLCSRRPTRVPLITKRHRQLHLELAREHRDWTMDEWKRMNPDFSFITSMVMSGYAVCQANSCFPLVQQVIHRLVVAVLCFGGRSHGRLWDP